MKSKLTIADIVAPGEILDLLRTALGKASSFSGVVLVTLNKAGELEIAYGGLDDIYHAAGVLEAGKILLLDGCDDEDED